uniref:DUF6882 domain-containing protein n=1 Tax=Thaumasiovibrio occultus TaxID=1891184 RepID=UPI000B35EE94|nr:DUF6882 domain-containing protein [Thaumasiovibrio occultus]
MRVIFILLLQIASFMSAAQEPLDLDDYVDAAMGVLRNQADIHDVTWQIGEAERVYINQTEGVIWWTFADGKEVTAPVQIIGTYDPSNDSFLWGWDHPSVQPALREHAQLVKEFGETYNIAVLTQPMVTITEQEAWQFVAMANRLGSANGGYRAEAGGPLVFVTFGDITLKYD